MKEFDSVKYRNDYNKEHYERITLSMKKDEKEIFLKQAENRGYKKFSEYVRALIYQDMTGGGTD